MATKKSKIINTASKIISAPSVIKSKVRQAKSDRDFRVLKQYNKVKNLPNSDAYGKVIAPYHSAQVAGVNAVLRTRNAIKRKQNGR